MFYPQKIQLMLKRFFVWPFKLKILNLFSPTVFFLIWSCSISHMYDLHYIILQHSETHFYKLSENTYFYQAISTDLVL